MLPDKRFYAVVIMILILLYAGPVNGMVFSLHPVSDDGNTFFDPRLVGKWGDAVAVDLTSGVNGEVMEELYFTCEFKEASGGYELIVNVKEEGNIEFHARLVRIWGENWLEVSPSTGSLLDFLAEGKPNPLLLVELYWFFKVEELGSELLLSVMDAEWMLERLQTVSRHMDYAHRDFMWFDRIYLTSQPHELKPFLARISRFREALPYGVKMTRIRVKRD